jgi:hypothetical protein
MASTGTRKSPAVCSLVRPPAKSASSKGVTSICPNELPIHQLSHEEESSARSTIPAAHSVALPKVALKGCSTKKTSSSNPARSRARGNPASNFKLRKSQTASTASRLLITEMEAAGHGASPRERASASCPAKTPGHTAAPKRNAMASAIPSGAKSTGVTSTSSTRTRKLAWPNRK